MSRDRSGIVLPPPGRQVPTAGWGVVGTGGIANAFAADLALSDTQHVTAVASRRSDRAEVFAQHHSGASRTGKLRSVRPYDDLAEMIADPVVEMIYVATPNTAHADAVTAALEAGKPVVCEKPLATSAGEARELVRLARQRRTLLMEALWTRHLPAVRKAHEAVARGLIGEVVAIRGDCTRERPFDPRSRLFDPALGGGALLDLGVYPLSLAILFAGRPDRADGKWWRNPAGTDGRAEMTLRCGEVDVALACGFQAEHRNRFVVQGTRGALELDDTLRPVELTLHERPLAALPPAAEPRDWTDTVAGLLPIRGEGRRFDHDFPGRGLRFQASRAAQCLRHGVKECPEAPLDDTIAVLEVIDAIRAQDPAGDVQDGDL